MGIGIGVYTKYSREAVELYCKVFGLELGYHVLTEDGNYFHSELMKDGETFLSVAQSNHENLPNGLNKSYDNPVELGFTVASKEEFYSIYSALEKEGKVIMDVCELAWSPLAAIVMDKFGVRWYITLPQHRPSDNNLTEYIK